MQRQLAEQVGTRLPTGVALLTGASLDWHTLDFPLSNAEERELERLQALIGRRVAEVPYLEHTEPD